MSALAIGHNGGPAFAPFNRRAKCDRIMDLLEDPTINAVQKCIGIAIIMRANKDAVAEVPTSDLLRYASIKDKETVFKATRKLSGSYISKDPGKGKPNRYTVLPKRVVDAVVDAYNTSKGRPMASAHFNASEGRQDPPSTENELGGFDRSRPMAPDRLDRPSPTPSAQPVSQPSRARKESPSEIDNTYENRKIGSVVPSTPRAIPHEELNTRLLAACNGSLGNPGAFPALANLTIPIMWLENGADLERDVLPTIAELSARKKGGSRITSWSYFTNAVAEAKARRQAGLPTADVVADRGGLSAQERRDRAIMGDARYEAFKAKQEAGHGGR